GGGAGRRGPGLRGARRPGVRPGTSVRRGGQARRPAGRGLRPRHRQGSAGPGAPAPGVRGGRLPCCPHGGPSPTRRRCDCGTTAAHRRRGPVVTPVGMVTYSTKPRGGVVHMLALAEALARRSFPVEIIALGDATAGFYRPVAVPCSFVPPPEPAPELEARVFDAIDALEAGLMGRGGSLPQGVHVQGWIAA